MHFLFFTSDDGPYAHVRLVGIDRESSAQPLLLLFLCTQVFLLTFCSACHVDNAVV